MPEYANAMEQIQSFQLQSKLKDSWRISAGAQYMPKIN